jgi:hypothetical protein
MAVTQAIIQAVKSAHGLGVLPSYQDLRGGPGEDSGQ